MAEQMRASTVKRAFRLPLDEVSALCIRRGRARSELLAVGDEDYAVHCAIVRDASLEQGRRRGLGDALPRETRDERGGSEWEAVAADGVGRVFVLRESTATVFVFSPGLRKLKHIINLDVAGSDDARARHMLDDPNEGPEGVLLLGDGHILVVKQKDPIAFIEFGPEDHHPKGLSKESYLPEDRSFRLSDGQRTTLTALASWELDADAERTVKSANDLAVDDREGLHAVSSKTRCIYELETSRARDGKISIADAWRLPADLLAGDDRKAEGLTFDRQGRPLVALDVQDRGENVFLLERLERADR